MTEATPDVDEWSSHPSSADVKYLDLAIPIDNQLQEIAPTNSKKLL